MASTYQQLIGLHRAEFNKAADLQSKILIAQAALAIIAVLAVFTSDARTAYGCAVISCIAAGCWIWLWLKFKESRSLAERVRRLTLMAEDLGLEVSKAELLQIKASFSVSDQEAERLADPNYYDVAGTPGPARLAEKLEQSAFWSAFLLRKSAEQVLVYLAVPVIFIAALLLSIPLLEADWGLAGARVACAAILFPLSTDFLGAYIGYRSAAQEVDQVLARLRTARVAGYQLPDVLTIMGDYNAAVEAAPMFARGVYEKHNNRLNDLWSQYRKAGRQEV
ncbi:MAG TPA: hypothetical protein VEY95_10335 [Azospirillaceae bacterium]|nr:hypothetical protein [Azospirillaceae bacterium]